MTGTTPRHTHQARRWLGFLKKSAIEERDGVLGLSQRGLDNVKQPEFYREPGAPIAPKRGQKKATANVLPSAVAFFRKLNF